MAGYKETFGANVDYAYGRGVTDLTSRLNQGVAGLTGAGKGISAYASQMRAAKTATKDLANTMQDLRDRIEDATDPREIKRLAREIDNARKSADKFRKQMMQVPFNAMEAGIGKLTKGLLKFNAGILTMGFDFLIDSIKRVYELQERWTHAIGGFNMKLGGMTKGMAGATKAAVQWSSTIRGLTNGSIEEGIQLFGEFTMAIGRTVTAGDKFSKLGVQMARGFGIGGTGAGQILKVFENIGMSADDSAEAMKTSIKAANAANIPVNMLAEDISKSVTYMARFGKEGQKTLIQGAAWARKYDISLEQLRQSVESFDMFDDAAKSVSKLNAMFGTMINSMDLMMEDDPAKRLDMIREQMLAQGMTYDKLSPKQRRYFSETLKLSEEQTAALLDAQNAGESYADFQAKAEAKQKNELKAKEMMQKMLSKTAQTMYAFGMAFDRVTMAIGKAIKPLLEVLGLAKKSDKEFKGFGSVMAGITDTVVKFFESLAGNDKWQSFMRELAKDLLRAGAALKDFVISGRAADMVGDIAHAMKSFYVTVRDLAIRAAPMFKPLLNAVLYLSQHIKELAIAWAGLKIFNMAGGASAITKIGGMLKGGGMAGRLGMAGAAGAAGYALGGKGAGVGAGAGSMIGGIFGPLGSAAGAVLGGLIGKGVEKFFFSNKQKDALTEAQEELAKAMKKEQAAREAGEAMEKSFMSRRRADEIVRKATAESLDKVTKRAQMSKEKDVVLSKEEAQALVSRASQLSMFADKTKITQEQLSHLGEGSRLTFDQLSALQKGSAAYDKALEALRGTSEKILQQQMAQLEVSTLSVKKEGMRAAADQAAADIASGRAAQKAGLGQFEAFGKSDKFKMAKAAARDGGNAIDELIKFQEADAKGFAREKKKLNAKEQEQLETSMKIRKAELFASKSKLELIKLEARYLEEERSIKLRSLEMGSERFLKYQKESGIDDTAQAFAKYLEDRKGELTGVYGSAAYDILARQPKLAKGGIVTRPTSAIVGESGPEAVIPLSRMKGAMMNGEHVVSTPVEINIDGQRVGRAIIRSAIRGRS